MKCHKASGELFKATKPVGGEVVVAKQETAIVALTPENVHGALKRHIA